MRRRYADLLFEIAEHDPLIDITYGTFPGGDPRMFAPDEAIASWSQKLRWERACEEWNRGAPDSLDAQCFVLGNGESWAGRGFGPGISIWWLTEEEAEFINAPLEVDGG